MTDKFLTLQSYIDSPVAKKGYTISPPRTQVIVYSGEVLPYFLLKHGISRDRISEFLVLNKIGCVESDLYIGRPVLIPESSDFLSTNN